MTEPEREYEKLRRASRELGEQREFVIEPVEESEEYAEAVRDDAVAGGLGPSAAFGPRAVPGLWESTVSAGDVARALGLRTVAVEPDGAVWWQETRPDDGVGGCLVRCDPRDPGTVHVLDLRVDCDGDAVPVGDRAVVSGRADGQLYLIRPGEGARRITGRAGNHRYADLALSPDGKEIWCVRESRDGDAVEQPIVAVPLETPPRSRRPRCGRW